MLIRHAVPTIIKRLAALGDPRDLYHKVTCVTNTLNVCPQAKIRIQYRLTSWLGLAGHILHYSTKLF